MIEQERLLANPFPGLRPFEMEESELFFGRDGQSDEVLSKLRAARFVAVVGTSGSGKSSLVRAGLLPALLSGHMTSAGSSWRLAIFRPGHSPIASLAAALSEPGVFGAGDEAAAAERRTTIERALRRSSLGLLEVVAQSGMAPHENLLILADQFEELFRFGKKGAAAQAEDEPAAFVKLLLEARQADKPPEERLPVYVILTMRSDYLGDCAHFRGLPEAINDGQYLIPRMTDDDRREAINGPAILGGARLTPPLVNRLLNDAGDDPARLPILQHALMRTWDEWKEMGPEHRAVHRGEALDLCCYEAVGGMSEALSRHADEAYLELTPERQTLAEKIFKGLTEKEADHREGRRPATVAELAEAAGAEPSEVMAVVENFRREGRSFLMPPPATPLTPETLVDISHESLIRGWARLRRWVDEEAQSARQYKRLAEAAALFPDQEGHLRDPALSIGLKWLEDTKPTRAWAQRYHPGFDKTVSYLEESRANREREAEERERQRERELHQAQALAAEQRRRLKQQRLGMLILTILLLGMAGLTAYAFQQKREADHQSVEAVRQRAEANGHRQRAESALLTAERERDVARRAQESEAVQKEAAETAKLTAEGERDRALKAEAEADRQRDAAERDRAEAERQKGIAEGALTQAKEDREKAQVAQAAAERALIAVNEEQKKTTEALALVEDIDKSAPFFHSIKRGHRDVVNSVAFSPDGELLVTGSEDSYGILWERAGSRRVGAWGPVAGNSIPPRGDDDDGEAPVDRVVFSPDGKWILALRDGASAELWSVGTPRTAIVLEGSGEVGENIGAFSPDGRLVAVPAYHQKVQLWDIGDDGRPTLRGDFPTDHKGVRTRLEFSPDGRLLLTASADGRAALWDVATRKHAVWLLGHLSLITDAEFSHDGKFVVTASEDGTARVWNTSDGQSLTLAGHEGRVTSAAFSRKSNRYVVTTSEKRAYLWEAKSPDAWVPASPQDSALSANSPTIFGGHTDLVTDAVFTPDDRLVITASLDRTAQVWRAKTEPGVAEGNATRPATVASHAVLRGHIKPLTSVEVSKDAKYVVTGSADKTARVWDLTGIGAFSVGDVKLSAEPANYEGNCPVVVKFTGRITAAGGTGTVKYRFVSSNGNPGLDQELTFDAPGTKEVSFTREIYSSPVGRGGKPIGPAKGWAEIEILEPAQMKSERAAFSVVCRDSGAQQVAVEDELTDAQLRQIMPNAKPENRALYLPHIRKAMAEFGINTPLRQAAFLAMLAYETGELRVLEEQQPDTWLNQRYSGRKDLGNYEPGDGARFKGRGGFHITGRANYQAFSGGLGVDLVANPQLLATPEYAFRSAAFYWRRLGLNEMADREYIEGITRRINGALVGLEERTQYYTRAKAALGAVPARQ